MSTLSEAPQGLGSLGAARRLLVLASGDTGCVAVDLESGSFIRAQARGAEMAADPSVADLVGFAATTWVVGTSHLSEVTRPGQLSVVTAEIGEMASSVPDPARPEARAMVGPLHHARPLRRRRLRGVLDGLVAPVSDQLLGSPGPAVAFWELRGDRGSVALVVPSQGPVVYRPRGSEGLRARFRWGASSHDLPVVDNRAVQALTWARHGHWQGTELARRLGWTPHYLLVALTGPRLGHCYKVVAGLLPRP